MTDAETIAELKRQLQRCHQRRHNGTINIIQAQRAARDARNDLRALKRECHSLRREISALEEELLALKSKAAESESFSKRVP